MPAIRSKDFNTSLLSSGAPKWKKSEKFTFTSIPIKYDGKDCFVKVKGNFKYLSMITMERSLTPLD